MSPLLAFMSRVHVASSRRACLTYVACWCSRALRVTDSTAAQQSIHSRTHSSPRRAGETRAGTSFAHTTRPVRLRARLRATDAWPRSLCRLSRTCGRAVRLDVRGRAAYLFAACQSCVNPAAQSTSEIGTDEALPTCASSPPPESAASGPRARTSARGSIPHSNHPRRFRLVMHLVGASRCARRDPSGIEYVRREIHLAGACSDPRDVSSNAVLNGAGGECRPERIRDLLISCSRLPREHSGNPRCRSMHQHPLSPLYHRAPCPLRLMPFTPRAPTTDPPPPLGARITPHRCVA